MSADRHQRAAHVGDRGAAVERGELADRVEHADVARGERRAAALAAQRGAAARAPRERDHVARALRMARREDQRRALPRLLPRALRGEQRLLLSRMRAARDHERRVAEPRREIGRERAAASRADRASGLR